jgi:hypothetical protein
MVSTRQVAVMAEALKVNTVLRKLDLGNRNYCAGPSINKVGSAGAKSLADALFVNSVLTSLDLWGCDIGDEGAKAIADTPTRCVLIAR